MLMARGELTSSSTLKGRPPLRQVTKAMRHAEGGQ